MPNICLSCIGDEQLRERLEGGSSTIACDFCEENALGLTLEELADEVAPTLRQYCQIGEERAILGLESEKVEFEQEGEELAWLLQLEMEIEPEIADQLAALLVQQDPADVAGGEDRYFDFEQRYHRRHLMGGVHAGIWRRFSERIKHERRFFDAQGLELLARIMGERGDWRAAALPILEVGPGTRIERLFRGRRALTEDETRRFARYPVQELGPPPTGLASPGRMNPAGVRVFYGGLSIETVVAELRPPVGSRIVVAAFRPARKLRLLDLLRIQVAFSGSIFAPDYELREDRCRFLGSFHSLIASPIEPHHEGLEYVPTQAVAEYVANVLGLDGILYGSAQVGGVPEPPEPEHGIDSRPLSAAELEQCNIVLFGNSALVAVPEAAGGGDEVASVGAAGAALLIESGSVQTVYVESVRFSHIACNCRLP